MLLILLLLSTLLNILNVPSFYAFFEIINGIDNKTNVLEWSTSGGVIVETLKSLRSPKKSYFWFNFVNYIHRGERRKQ